MTRSEWTNIALIGVACGAAHLAPAATLLGSYAFLGPAHYLTELSWLRDRGWFTKQPRLIVPLALAAAATMLVPTGSMSAPVMGGLIGACIAGAAGATTAQTAIAGALMAVAASALATTSPSVALAILVLLPTIVHVFGFTSAFILRGVSTSTSKTRWAVPGALAAAAASFLLLPTSGGNSAWTESASNYFGDVGRLLQPGDNAAGAAVLGFVAMAYAYHYLNWFAKTGTVGWHRAPQKRLVVIVVLWCLCTLAYLHSFALGFLVSFPLGAAHVALELPLNAVTLRALLLPSRRKPA